MATPLNPCAEVPVHPIQGRLWANVRPIGAQTPVPDYPLEPLYDTAAIEGATQMSSLSLADIVKAWNTQADEFNQWPTLTEAEKVEFAYWLGANLLCGEPRE